MAISDSTIEAVLRAVRAWYQSWLDHEAVPDEGLPEEQALYHACKELFGEETGS